jgi:hypothetical protein
MLGLIGGSELAEKADGGVCGGTELPGTNEPGGGAAPYGEAALLGGMAALGVPKPPAGACIGGTDAGGTDGALLYAPAIPNGIGLVGLGVACEFHAPDEAVGANGDVDTAAAAGGGGGGAAVLVVADTGAGAVLGGGSDGGGTLGVRVEGGAAYDDTAAIPMPAPPAITPPTAVCE